ncbi:MAG TPA: hypothetical protein VFW63_03130 [Acidimicrobiales bacterium]|nr:hypothetical protein [Acidimicrobiales bacterium]
MAATDPGPAGCAPGTGTPAASAPAASAPPAPRRLPGAAQGPPRRPRDVTPGELRFTPQPATRWFSPGVLTQSALKVAVTSVFGSFLDKRELQSTRPAVVDVELAGEPDLWFDYVADTGDGFEATATVAHQVARPELVVDVDGRPTTLPRGRLLVMGGDEVYPTASTEGYEQRLEGPWRAALPWTPPPDPDSPAHPRLYAVPGNHDWDDGLTGFLRMFAQGRWIGGWRTRQARSYFAVQLPHRWWLWGVDIQADALVDDPQLSYFDWVAGEHARPGDRVVLAAPVPTWTHVGQRPQAHRNLAYLERTVLAPHGLDLRLTLAGDDHHYARYEERLAPGATGPAHKVTAGGGGAFLHPTHALPDRAELAVDRDDPARPATYDLRRRYPDPRTSRRLSLGAVLLPVRNPSFLVVPGLASLTLLWTVQFGLRSIGTPGGGFADAAASWGWLDVFGGVFRTSLSLLMVLLLWLGLFAFARTPPWVHGPVGRSLAKGVLSLAHVLAHLAAMTAVGMAAVRVARLAPGGGCGFALTAGVVSLVLGAVAGSLVVGVYLAACIGLPLHAHANEAFAAARITGWKSFLRVHVERDRLTVYALGIDRAVRRRAWRVAADAEDPSAPWIEPARGAIRTHLVERVVVEAARTAPTRPGRPGAPPPA